MVQHIWRVMFSESDIYCRTCMFPSGWAVNPSWAEQTCRTIDVSILTELPARLSTQRLVASQTTDFFFCARLILEMFSVNCVVWLKVEFFHVRILNEDQPTEPRLQTCTATPADWSCIQKASRFFLYCACKPHKMFIEYIVMQGVCHCHIKLNMADAFDYSHSHSSPAASQASRAFNISTVDRPAGCCKDAASL